MAQIRITAFIISALFLLLTYYMVRRHRLKVSYAMVWLGTCAAMLFAAAFPGALPLLSRITGLYYLTALLLLTFVFLMLLLLHFSSVISRLIYQNRVLAERIAFLEQRMDDGGAKPG